MITIKDCIGLCGLTGEEADAIAAARAAGHIERAEILTVVLRHCLEEHAAVHG